MAETLIAVDPGMSSGIIVATVTPETPVQVQQVIQVEGGLAGFRAEYAKLPVGTMICESFHTRPTARSYRTDELEPIRIEGWLEGRRDGVIIWQRPEARKIVAGEMRESTRILDRMGLRVAPRDVGLKDANDANSAMLHLIAFLRNSGHKPTLEAINGALGL